MSRVRPNAVRPCVGGPDRQRSLPLRNSICQLISCTEMGKLLQGPGLSTEPGARPANKICIAEPACIENPAFHVRLTRPFALRNVAARRTAGNGTPAAT